MDDRVLTGWVAGATQANWFATSSLEIASPDGFLQLVVSCDRVDADLELDAYADARESSMTAGLGPATQTDTAVAPLLAGLPTRTRIVAWRQGDEEISTLLAFALADGFGLRCHASAPTAQFAARLGELVGVIAGLRFPCSPDVSAAAATDQA